MKGGSIYHQGGEEWSKYQKRYLLMHCLHVFMASWMVYKITLTTLFEKRIKVTVWWLNGLECGLCDK